MTLYNSVGRPLFRNNPINRLYDDLEKISSIENSSENLTRYALTLQLAYLNTYSGLDTLLSNSSGDPSLNYIVSANNIGRSLGNTKLSELSIFKILSSCQSPLSNGFILNQHPAFKPVYDDLLKRHNHLQSLGFVSSIGGLPLQGGSLGSLQYDGSLGLASFSQYSQNVVPSNLISSTSTIAGFRPLGLDEIRVSSNSVPVSGSESLVLAAAAHPDSGALELVRNSHKEVIVHKRGSNRNSNSKSDGVVLSREILEPLFRMPIGEAAINLGICTTALKNACRKLGIIRWPYPKTYPPPISRSQRRGPASSVSSRQAASSSSRTSFSTQEVAAGASLSDLREAGDAFQGASSSSGTSLPGTFASSSSLEEAASSSSRTSYPTQEVTEVEQSRDNSDVLEVGSGDECDNHDVRNDYGLLPPISQEGTSQQTYTRRGPGSLPPGSLQPGFHKIGRKRT